MLEVVGSTHAHAHAQTDTTSWEEEGLVFVIRHFSGKTNVPLRLKAEGSSLGRVSSRGSTRLVPAYSTQFAKCVTRCTGARTETEVCPCTSPAVAIFPTEAPRLP